MKMYILSNSENSFISSILWEYSWGTTGRFQVVGKEERAIINSTTPHHLPFTILPSRCVEEYNRKKRINKKGDSQQGEKSGEFVSFSLLLMLCDAGLRCITYIGAII